MGGAYVLHSQCGVTTRPSDLWWNGTFGKTMTREIPLLRELNSNNGKSETVQRASMEFPLQWTITIPWKVFLKSETQTDTAQCTQPVQLLNIAHPLSFLRSARCREFFPRSIIRTRALPSEVVEHNKVIETKLLDIKSNVLPLLPKFPRGSKAI